MVYNFLKVKGEYFTMVKTAEEIIGKMKSATSKVTGKVYNLYFTDTR